MNNIEQRLALLTHLGWCNLTQAGRRGTDGPLMALRGTTPQGIKNQVAPNYYTNLNAMHEVVAGLTREEREFYSEMLVLIMDIRFPKFEGIFELRPAMLIAIHEATAPQRLHALLLALDLWKE